MSEAGQLVRDLSAVAKDAQAAAAAAAREAGPALAQAKQSDAQVCFGLLTTTFSAACCFSTLIMSLQAASLPSEA